MPETHLSPPAAPRATHRFRCNELPATSLFSPLRSLREVLFDGKSTAAFRGYKSDKIPEGWAVEGDVLHVLPGKHGGDLMTKEKFENFELSYEWKVSPGGNSGVIYKVLETQGPAWHTGF